MAKHKGIYVISSYTKKVFANIRRQGQGFSRNVTPLFETIMVNAQEELGEGLGFHTDSYYTPTDTTPSSSKPQKKTKPKRKLRQAIDVHSPSSEIPVKESIPTPSNDPLPSGKDSIQLSELMIFCTNLQQQVLDLEEAKTAQANEITSLKKRVKKLEKRSKSKPAGLRRLKKERMYDSNMFGVDDLEVTAASVENSVASTTTTTADVDDELTLDKGKAKMTEHEKTLKKKDQIALDEEVARKLKAEMKAKMEEEERIAREKDEANRAVIEEWDDV
uniref:Uncharacterized protein n=1 Tax=Tanacetum cinerariifolium TaxID=118510 RepID=A0A6L2LX49_TANCI|nr:hypothetical protein [Tanacetum cinerariifolium]